MPDVAETQKAIDELRELGRKKDKSRWQKSLIALLAGNAADVASSWGHGEANSLLAGKEGKFGAKGLAIKGGITGAMALAEYLLSRKDSDLYKYLTPMNYGAAALPAAMSVRNFSMK